MPIFTEAAELRGEHLREEYLREEYLRGAGEGLRPFSPDAEQALAKSIEKARISGVIYPETVIEAMYEQEGEARELIQAALRVSMLPQEEFERGLNSITRLIEQRGQLQVTPRFRDGLFRSNRYARLIGGARKIEVPHLLLGMVCSSSVFERQHSFSRTLKMGVLERYEEKIVKSGSYLRAKRI